MTFSWKTFLQQHRINFVTSGPNTGRNRISIRCPFCGESDPSEHMGLSITRNPYWGCLRNASHRGKSPVRLVRQLLHCSEQEAKRIVGGAEAPAVAENDLRASLVSLRASMGVKALPSPGDALRLPKEFKPLLGGSPFAEPFLEYLRERGYRDAQIRWLAENYKLHYATKGKFAYRIIIPVYDRYGDLLSWTGRTILPDVQPRYKTLSVSEDPYNPEGPIAKIPVNGTILGLPVLWRAENARVLVLVEGPFDALKVTAFGAALGVYAACLFGLNVYPAQLAEVQELASKFRQVYLLLDEDASLQRLRLLNALRPARVLPLKMPEGSDDPGALSAAAVTQISLDLINAAV